MPSFSPRRTTPLAAWRSRAWLAMLLVAALLVGREVYRLARGGGAGQTAAPQALESPPPPAKGSAIPQLDEELWSGVQDDTVFRSGEFEPFYRLLAGLKAASPEELRRASQGAAGYLGLSQQTPEYRGRLVTIRGRARRALAVKAAANDHGIESFLQIWIRPDDSTAGPLVVNAASLPAGFPMGYEIDAPVELEGVVFKRWAYSASDGTRTAPLLLAQGLRWTPSTAGEGGGPPNLALLIGVAAAIAASAIFWIWMSTPRKVRLASEAPPP